jgi:hypothetical protein
VEDEGERKKNKQRSKERMIGKQKKEKNINRMRNRAKEKTLS